MRKFTIVPAYAFFISYLNPVISLPQNGGWDVAVGTSHPRKIPYNNSKNNGDIAVAAQITAAPPPKAGGAKAPPRIKNPRHRPTCDLSLEDQQVCASGEACVEDPWTLKQGIIDAKYMETTVLGICTPDISSNMCNGFAGPARKCSNDAEGWKCAKPSRCTRENIADCDWLCVRPPPTSAAGGKGFGFKA